MLELITPPGSTTHHTSNPLGLLPGATIFESVRDGLTATPGEAVYEEVEVSLPSGKKGRQGKKETVKVKREISSTENPFSDWKTTEWSSAPLSTLPLSQAPTEAQACLRGIQVSPFNPPPPPWTPPGHQLDRTLSILEGDVYTLVCCSRGWYVSRSNVNTFDPTPRSPSDGCTHSLIDLLHTLSPLFSERLALLAPLSQEPPKREPIAIVPVPQYEPAYSFLAPTPGKGPAAEPLRAQMAYLHTGATTADALDAARDWNEELQNVKELPREGMQERVLREKMAHKTWAEFNAASIRVVMAIAVRLFCVSLMTICKTNIRIERRYSPSESQRRRSRPHVAHVQHLHHARYRLYRHIRPHGRRRRRAHLARKRRRHGPSA